MPMALQTNPEPPKYLVPQYLANPAKPALETGSVWSTFQVNFPVFLRFIQVKPLFRKTLGGKYPK
jgi:hypothetical protein